MHHRLALYFAESVVASALSGLRHRFNGGHAVGSISIILKTRG